MGHEPRVVWPILGSLVLGLCPLSCGRRSEDRVSVSDKPIVAPDVEFYGETSKTFVRLLWAAKTWPEGLKGFDVVRRSAKAEGGDWETLTSEAIAPQLLPAPDLSRVESDPGERRRILAAFAKLFKENGGTVEPLDSTRVRDAAAHRKGFTDLLRHLATQRFEYALAAGFGYVDRRVTENDRFTYGLVPRYERQDVKPSPIATYESIVFAENDERLRSPRVACVQERDQVLIEIDFPTRAAKTYGVTMFRVLRRNMGATEFQEAGEPWDLVAASRDEADVTTWWWYDEKVEPGKSYEYAVTPVSIFRTSLPSRTVAEYRPRPAGADAAKLDVPTIKAVQADKDRAVVIQWEFDKAQENAILGFAVERVALEPGDGSFERISSKLHPTARSFSDPILQGDLKEERNGAFMYRVVAITANKEVHISKPFLYNYLVVPLPPKPEDLKAEWIRREDRTYVQLSWKPRAKDDKNTRGFVIYHDQARGMAHALKIGMPRLLTDSEYLYEVAAPNDAEHRFAVAGINRMAQEGERAEVAVAVLGSWFAPVPKATFVWDGNVGSPVTIKWEYPAAARLKGFRIYQGDRLLADESALKADAREFDCGKRTEFYGNRYFVEAVSNYGPTSKRVVVDRDLTDFPKDIYPPRPTDITAEWVKGGDRSNVLLKWTAPPRAERLVKGYIVFVDEDEVDGSMKQLPDTLVKGTQFTYTPPREGRSYRFFVESVTPAGTRSASASPVLLLAPGAVLPPATLMRPDSAVVDDDVELAWQYPPMPNLKGFRIYLDGQLLADEKTLDARARKHSFTLKKPGKFGLQIEAVPVEGPVSERGPSQPLRVAK